MTLTPPQPPQPLQPLWPLWPFGQIAFPLGPGPLFGLAPLARSPSRSGQGHFSAQDGPGPPTKVPRAAQDHQHRPQERHKTANKGPESGQDHQHKPRGQRKIANKGPKIANIGPKSGPRPPT